MKLKFDGISTNVDANFKLGDHVDGDYDNGCEERILWSKKTYKCELDKEIEFKLALRVQDIYGLCGDCKGEVTLEVLLVPLAKCCSAKTLERASYGAARHIDEDDLLNYGCYVLMGRETLYDVEGDNPLDTDAVKNKVNCAVVCFDLYGSLCGFYLDRYQNRIGSTGWDYLNEWCHDIDSCKAALDRWEASKKKAG